jgi:chemotaxis protein histidine kinase CheA
MSSGRIEAFVRESRDGITELNNGLLALEQDPDDEEAMEGIFRTAHTLKGNFGALGFDDASNLAHAMEDLLDSIRGGGTDVTPDVMDLLFAAVDQIEVLIDDIDETGEPQSGPGDLPERLRGAIGTGDAGRDAAGATDPAGARRGTPTTWATPGRTPRFRSRAFACRFRPTGRCRASTARSCSTPSTTRRPRTWSRRRRTRSRSARVSSTTGSNSSSRTRTRRRSRRS